MQYIIGFLVLIAIVYYLWPYLVFAGLCAGGYFFLARRSRKRSVAKLRALIPLLEEKIEKLFFLHREKEMFFCRVPSIFIGGSDGGESLQLRIDTIFRDPSLPGESCHQYRSNSNFEEVMTIEAFSSRYTIDGIWSAIEDSINNRSLYQIEQDSFDSRICAIIFDNYPEAVWADDALKKIQETVIPITKAYAASLRNELLAANSKSLLKAITTLDREAEIVAKYCEDAYQALHKCSEFLSIPINLRNLVDYDVSTLEINNKQKEIRASFDEVLEIKREYESLGT